MANTVTRFTTRLPCPICQGHADRPRGHGERCFGFRSTDGDYAHCSREEYAGGLPLESDSQTYAHRLIGDCRCGTRHDPSPPASTNGHSGRNGHGRRLVATYDYVDAAGTLIYQTVRFEPKDFRQRRPDPNGKDRWTWNLQGIAPLIYRLPQVLAAIAAGETILQAEGEEDVHILEAHGYVATCNHGGAEKWGDAHSAFLMGAPGVVAFGDHDEAGRRHLVKQAASVLKVTGLTPRFVHMQGLPEHGDVRDWLTTHSADDLAQLIAEATPADSQILAVATAAAEDAADAVDPSRAWMQTLHRSSRRVPYESLGNLTIALQHLEPWATDCWYDEVRDILMVGHQEVTEALLTAAGLAIEAETHMLVRSNRLLAQALAFLCRQRPHDLLQDWLAQLPPWDHTPRLTSWLQTYAHAPHDAYSEEVSRLLITSLVARILHPGCQYRYVVILEGPENHGKTKLVRALATPEWYRELSHGLDGKEAHMRIKRALVVELAELSSFSKTEEARVKSFVTMNEDTYIPKFSNFEVSHLRRAIFVGTHNPDAGNTYLKGQTGNTRYLPLPVKHINLEGFEQVRQQLFAEALQDYRDHPTDWWQLSAPAELLAQSMREERREHSAHEEGLGAWLEQHAKAVTWWQQIAQDYLKLPPDRYLRTIQMDVAKALTALGWEKQQQERINGDRVWPWRPGKTWVEEHFTTKARSS